MNPIDQEFVNFDLQPIMVEKDVKLHYYDRPTQLDIQSFTNFPSRRSLNNRSLTSTHQSMPSSSLLGLKSQAKLLDFEWGEDNTFPILGR